MSCPSSVLVLDLLCFTLLCDLGLHFPLPIYLLYLTSFSSHFFCCLSLIFLYSNWGIWVWRFESLCVFLCAELHCCDLCVCGYRHLRFLHSWNPTRMANVIILNSDALLLAVEPLSPASLSATWGTSDSFQIQWHTLSTITMYPPEDLHFIQSHFFVKPKSCLASSNSTHQ